MATRTLAATAGGVGDMNGGRGTTTYRTWTAVLLGASALLSLGACVFQIVSIPSAERGPVGNYHDVPGSITWAAMMAYAGVMGILVARRQPQNHVGWVFSVGGACGSLSLAGDQWAAYALVIAPGSVPAGTVGYYLSYPLLYACWASLGVLLPLMFPDGSLQGRFRKVVAVAGAVSAALWSVSIFHPDLFDTTDFYADIDGVVNPLGSEIARPAIEFLSAVGLFGLFGSMFLAVGSLLPRVFRARGRERQQLKIVAYSAVVATVGLLVTANLRNVPVVAGTPAVKVIDVIAGILIAAIPASFAVAILRYRLYDIDIIINRTLVYALLTASLAGVYAGGVLISSSALGPVTEDSDIAVAAATLAVAGLFGPLRRTIQTFIDRRFYRARYDAQRTIDQFTARLRDQVALDTVAHELLGAVGQTLQPSTASVWLAQDKPSSSEAQG